MELVAANSSTLQIKGLISIYNSGEEANIIEETILNILRASYSDDLEKIQFNYYWGYSTNDNREVITQFGYNILIEAIRKNCSLELIKEMLNYLQKNYSNEDTNIILLAALDSIISWRLKEGYYVEIVKLIMRYPIDLNSPQEKRPGIADPRLNNERRISPPLITALNFDQREIIRIIFEHGADPKSVEDMVGDLEIYLARVDAEEVYTEGQKILGNERTQIIPKLGSSVVKEILSWINMSASKEINGCSSENKLGKNDFSLLDTVASKCSKGRLS